MSGFWDPLSLSSQDCAHNLHYMDTKGKKKWVLWPQVLSLNRVWQLFRVKGEEIRVTVWDLLSPTCFVGLTLCPWFFRGERPRNISFFCAGCVCANKTKFSFSLSLDRSVFEIQPWMMDCLHSSLIVSLLHFAAFNNMQFISFTKSHMHFPPCCYTLNCLILQSSELLETFPLGAQWELSDPNNQAQTNECHRPHYRFAEKGNAAFKNVYCWTCVLKVQWIHLEQITRCHELSWGWESGKIDLT